MKILFHGRLADVLGREMELPAETGCSIAELRERIAEHRPSAAGPILSQRIRACIGDTIVAEDHIVAPGEQVEFFPPVSGG